MQRDRTFPPTVLRWSELNKASKSGAHFRAAYTDPKEATAPMRLGSITHVLTLGGAGLLVWNGERRAGKEWEAFRADAQPGALIVSKKEYDQARRVADAVVASPLARPLLEGVHEHELAWTGPLNRKCAGRVDIATGKRLVELKTTTRAEPGWFARHAIAMNYHAQLAWYQDGARANGIPAEEAWIIAVETAAPFAVTVLELTERAIEQGRKACHLWVEKVVGWEQAGEWPGYAQSPVPLDVVDRVELEGLDDNDEEAA